MNDRSIFYRWIGFLYSIEGETVVREPNDTYSKYGVTKATPEEASVVTVSDMYSTARELWDTYFDDYNDVASSRLEALRMVDFAWNAGPDDVAHIINAHNPTVLGKGDPWITLIRENSDSITAGIAFVYERWAKVNPQRNGPYIVGWRRRQKMLREVYYNVNRLPYESLRAFGDRIQEECSAPHFYPLLRRSPHESVEECVKRRMSYDEDTGPIRKAIAHLDSGYRKLSRSVELLQVLW